MLDPALRSAERDLARSGTTDDAARLLSARLRAGAVDLARVRVGAALDDPVARLVVAPCDGPPPPVPAGVLPGSTLAWVLAAADAAGPTSVLRDEVVVRAGLAALDATWTAWTAWLEDTRRLVTWRARAEAWLAAPTPGAGDLVWKALPVIDDSAVLASDEAVRAAVLRALRPWLVLGPG